MESSGISNGLVLHDVPVPDYCRYDDEVGRGVKRGILVSMVADSASTTMRHVTWTPSRVSVSKTPQNTLEPQLSIKSNNIKQTISADQDLFLDQVFPWGVTS